ncbi:MAG: hypothetical protein ACFFEV_09645 [Candidatus Thorarchaeota archaeon]
MTELSREVNQEQWPTVRTYQFFAGIHFMRLLGLIAVLILEIFRIELYRSNFDPLLATGLLPLVFLDLLFGFLLLMRKRVVILPVTIYITILGLPFLLMSPFIPMFNPIFLLSYSCIIEMFIIALLGLQWVTREWVHDEQD